MKERERERDRDRERDKGRVGHYSARNPAIESGTKYLCFCESEREQWGGRGTKWCLTKQRQCH